MEDVLVEKVINDVSEISDFDAYLVKLGLPIKNVISKVSDRELVFKNIESIVTLLDDDLKSEAVYLSRFAAASYVGLFDASLNYLWDEVVLTLRKMVNQYGLEYFFDIVVPVTRRSDFSDVQDLLRIQDKDLIRACFELGLIDSVLNKELSHILDMRNFISAAHPNVENIGGFQLLGYLETCVKKVLCLKLSDEVLNIMRITDLVKNETFVFDKLTEVTMHENLSKFGSKTSNTVLKRMFWIYCDANSKESTKSKAILIASFVWDCAEDKCKYELGISFDEYTKKMEIEKARLSELFLKKLNGLKFLPKSTLSLKLNDCAERLKNAHSSWDNYYYEVPIIVEIMEMIDSIGYIPDEVFDVLTNAIVECRLGNSNRNMYYGVSSGGLPYYNKYFQYLNEDQAKRMIKLLIDNNFFILYSVYKRINLDQIMDLLVRESYSERLNEILTYIKNNEKITLTEDENFNRLIKNFIS